MISKIKELYIKLFNIKPKPNTVIINQIALINSIADWANTYDSPQPEYSITGHIDVTHISHIKHIYFRQPDYSRSRFRFISINYDRLLVQAYDYQYLDFLSRLIRIT